LCSAIIMRELPEQGLNDPADHPPTGASPLAP
jgi:hypothetical protein